MRLSRSGAGNTRRRRRRGLHLIGPLLLASALGALAAATAVAAGSAPPLGTAGSFAVLAGSAITNTGPTTIAGDLGLSPGSSVTGFPPGQVNGATHVDDSVAVQAKADLTTASNNAAGQPCDSTLTGDLGGRTLTPGVYCYSSDTLLTGTLTLNGGGDPNAVFIFRIGSALTTASNSRVSIVNGGACGVFWAVGSSVTLGTDTAFVGTIMATESITLNSRADILPGRALARGGALTLDSNQVATPPGSCSTASSSTSTALSSSANPSATGAPVTLTATVSAAGGGTPKGTVTFRDGTTTLGSAPLDSSGKATLTISLSPAAHTITAVYADGPGFLPSVSTPLLQAITAAPTPVRTPAPPEPQLPRAGSPAAPPPAPVGLVAILFIAAGLASVSLLLARTATHD